MSQTALFKSKRPFLAAVLSFILPGLGQIYAGFPKKGFTLLIVTMGIGISYLRAASLIMQITFGLIYLFFLIPAVQDAWALAKGTAQGAAQSKAYIILMLLAVGPFALPLLWQSDQFSREAKILWSFFVMVVAALFFLTLYAVGKLADTFVTI